MNLLNKNGIKYNTKELMDLSAGQMLKKITELGGNKRNPKQRAGENIP